MEACKPAVVFVCGDDSSRIYDFIEIGMKLGERGYRDIAWYANRASRSIFDNKGINFSTFDRGNVDEAISSIKEQVDESALVVVEVDSPLAPDLRKALVINQLSRVILYVDIDGALNSLSERQIELIFGKKIHPAAIIFAGNESQIDKIPKETNRVSIGYFSPFFVNIIKEMRQIKASAREAFFKTQGEIDQGHPIIIYIQIDEGPETFTSLFAEAKTDINIAQSKLIFIGAQNNGDWAKSLAYCDVVVLSKVDELASLLLLGEIPLITLENSASDLVRGGAITYASDGESFAQAVNKPQQIEKERVLSLVGVKENYGEVLDLALEEAYYRIFNGQRGGSVR